MQEDGTSPNPVPAPATFRLQARTVIHVEGAIKSYGKLQVLKDFNMHVQEHTIYGLLGSSGCGKTTILSCIVALRKLDAGKVFVCGLPAGTQGSGIPGKKVGYMPQEIALNLECTPKEVLSYFGRIYGMKKDQISERYDYLMRLLDLEECVKPVGCLSDGQKRRVSLAVALVHQPDILILDEPTVGVDPLLRESIWKHLHKLVFKRRATVIVTTHYIEEMRQADRIGIMRNGQLLAEDSPTRLLEDYNESLLNNVMVKLCQKNEDELVQVEHAEMQIQLQERRQGMNRSRSLGDPVGVSADNIAEALKVQWQDVNNQNPPFRRGRSVSFFQNTSVTTSFWNRIHALLVKDIIVLLRNIWFLLICVFMPCGTIAVFCISVGSNPTGLKVGVINHEANCLEGTRNYSQLTCYEFSGLSCHFLESADQNIVTFVQYDSVEDAIKDTRKSYIWGYVKFREDFSDSFINRMIEGDAISNETLIGSEVYVQLDMAGVHIGQTIQKVFVDAFRHFVAKLLTSCGVDPTGRDLPLTIGPPIYGKADDRLTNNLGPGVALGYIYFMCAIQCGLSFIVEKKHGILNRTLVSGVTTVEIMLAHFLVQLFVIALTQIILAFIIVHVIIQVPLEGSLVLAFSLVVFNAIAGMSVGFMLGGFCDDEKYAMLMAMGMIIPNFVIAGILWPIECLPVSMQYFSFILPGTLAGESLQSIVLRGFGLTHRVVWYGFVSTLSWTCFYLIVIVVSHKLVGRKK